MASEDGLTRYTPQIRGAMSSGTAVPVVGAGISQDAAGIPNWEGIVRSAIDHLARPGALDQPALQRLERLVSQEDLVSAGDLVRKELDQLNQLGPWLTEVFRKPEGQVSRWSNLNALLDWRCPLYSTTNYDTLLSDHDLYGTRAVLSWDEPGRAAAGLRDEPSVLHLHGVWNRPQSVVLGTADYAALTSDEASRLLVRSLWLERVLVFVGCSFDGMQDPDFFSLFDWMQSTFNGHAGNHFALVRTDSLSHDQRRDLLRHGVIPLEFGGEHADLASALVRLNPSIEDSRRALVGRIRSIVDRRTEEAPELARMFQQVSGGAVDRSTGEAAASALLDRADQNNRFRDELIALQSVGAAMLPPARLAATLDVVGQGPFVLVRLDDLRSVLPVARDAATFLQMFPTNVLQRLSQGGVGIHDSVFSGDAFQWLDLLELQVVAGEYDPDLDVYLVEHAQRLLRSAEEVLRAEPTVVLPMDAPGHVPPTEVGWLVVLRHGFIEVREPTPRGRMVGRLASIGERHFAAERVPTAAGPALLTRGKSTIALWSLPSGAEPISLYQVPNHGTITSAIHRTVGSHVESVVDTTAGAFRLFDLVEIDHLASHASQSSNVAGVPESGNGIGRLWGWPPKTRDEVVQLAARLHEQLADRGALPDGTRTIHVWDTVAEGSRPAGVIGVLVGVDRVVSGKWVYSSGLVAYEGGDLERPAHFFSTPAQNQLVCPRLLEAPGGYRLVAGNRADRPNTDSRLVVRSAIARPDGPFACDVETELVDNATGIGLVAMQDADAGWASDSERLWWLDFTSSRLDPIATGDGGSILALELLAWPQTA